ncbi:MAG: acyl-CoA dehydrogenase family protein, partial [Pseudomonadales bacterium]
ELDMCRLAVLKSAYMMDTIGNKEARKYISAIKVSVPNMTLKIVDRAIQIYGALGVSQDTPLAAMWTGQRTLRLADGPDEVHKRVIAREELKKYQ